MIAAAIVFLLGIIILRSMKLGFWVGLIAAILTLFFFGTSPNTACWADARGFQVIAAMPQPFCNPLARMDKRTSKRASQKAGQPARFFIW